MSVDYKRNTNQDQEFGCVPTLGGGWMTLPSSNIAGPLGISPITALAALSKQGSSSYRQSSSPP